MLPFAEFALAVWWQFLPEGGCWEKLPIRAAKTEMCTGSRHVSAICVRVRGKETVSALSTFASSSMANIPHVRGELATPRRSLSICGSICCPLAHIARSFFPLPSLLLGSIWNGRRCREDNRSELATISRSPLLRGERIGYRGSKAHRGTNIPIFPLATLTFMNS